MREIIVSFVSEGRVYGSDLVWAPFQWIQLWAWERFSTVSPKPACLVDGEPRVARWHNLPNFKVGRLRSEVEFAEDIFLWRPYALSLENWKFPKFYCDHGMKMLVHSGTDEELLSFARCLRGCELLGMDCFAEKYLPHRLGMQFGLDQDIPVPIPRCNVDLDLAWSTYDKPLDGLKLYLPPRLLEGDVTVRYYKWWRDTLGFTDDEMMGIKRCRRSSRKIKKLPLLLDTRTERNDGKHRISSPFLCAEVATSYSDCDSREVREGSPTCIVSPLQNPSSVNEIVYISVYPMKVKDESEKHEHLVEKGETLNEVSGSDIILAEFPHSPVNVDETGVFSTDSLKGKEETEICEVAAKVKIGDTLDEVSGNDKRMPKLPHSSLRVDEIVAVSGNLLQGDEDTEKLEHVTVPEDNGMMVNGSNLSVDEHVPVSVCKVLEETEKHELLATQGDDAKEWSGGDLRIAELAQNPLNVDDIVAIRLNRLNGQEDLDKGKHVSENVDNGKEVSGSDINVVVPSQNSPNVDEIRAVSICPLKAQDESEKCQLVAVNKDIAKEMTGMAFIRGSSSKHSKGGIPQNGSEEEDCGTEIGLLLDSKETKLSSVFPGDANDNAAENMVFEPLNNPSHSDETVDTSPIANPINDVMIIDVEEEDGNNHNTFEELCSDLEAQVSALERVVSMLQKAKFGTRMG